MKAGHAAAATPETPDSSEASVRQSLGYNLKRSSLLLQPIAQAALADLGLRVLSYSGLSVIVANPGITPSQLAETLSMERTNIAVIIDELTRQGLITRKRMETDRRSYELTATDTGRELNRKAAEAVARAEDTVLAGLSRQDRAELTRLLLKLEATVAAGGS